jgi:hypothetical protein
MQGCHSQEICPNCKGSHIAFSSRCANKAEATRAARVSRRPEPATQTREASGEATGPNRTAPSLRRGAPEEGEKGSREVEQPDATIVEVDTAHVKMAESVIAAGL